MKVSTPLFREDSRIGLSAQADPARGGSRNCPQDRPQATASGMICEKSSVPFVRRSKVYLLSYFCLNISLNSFSAIKLIFCV
jgi:hypothetical protein